MSTPPFPPLEIISEESTQPERRRLPRLNLSAEQFRSKESGKIYSVVDLSTGGMAFRLIHADELIFFTAGKTIQGTLNVKREKYLVKAQVKHVRQDLIGCEFTEISKSLEEALVELLSPEALGAELKLLPMSDLGTVWYHGSSGTNLILKRNEEGLCHQFDLFVLGFFVHWDNTKGLQTGRMTHSHQKSEIRGPFRIDSLVLIEDQASDAEKLSVAKRLFLSSNLPEELKTWCAQQFN